MIGMETILKISVATPVVWRLTRMVAGAYGADGAFGADGQRGFGEASGLARVRPEDVLGSRVMDFLYWIGIWISAQTALWVACGFAGVLLNWLALSGIARLARRTKMVQLTARGAASGDVARSGLARSGLVSSSVARSGLARSGLAARETERQTGAAQLCQ